MSMAIRRASLPDDREVLLDLFDRHFGEFGNNHAPRFERQVMQTPDGEGWTWLAYERNDRSVVGTTSVFRRKMYVNGKRLDVGQVAFFAVNASHRSLGPAVMLQRATFEPVDSGELAFCYDCPPHDEGMSTFVRLGMPARCEVVRYTLPLRSDEYLAKRFGNSGWAKPVASMANLLLRVRRRQSKVSGIEISPFNEVFGEEFSHLDRGVSSRTVIRASRSAEVLNWLYRDYPPAQKHLPIGSQDESKVLVARRGGELLAFIIFSIQSDNLVIVKDIFGHDLTEIGRPLLDAVIEVAATSNMSGVFGYCAERSELSRLLRSAGFYPRATAARVVAYEKPNGAGVHLGSSLQWSFSQFDVMR